MTILETARLRLEPFDDNHFDGLLAMNERPEVMRYITGQPDSADDVRAGIARQKQRWAHFGFGWWTFIDKSSGRVAGAGCVQHLRPDEEPPLNLDLLRAHPLELGWRLHPDFWRQGLASEAAERMACFAFDDLAAAELYAVRDPNNLASGRVMDRLGMVNLGVQRWYGIDLAAHRVTRDAWRSRP